MSFAQTPAPGGPGRDAQWASAGKQGVGTSVTLGSKIWFTLEDGALTEVYYPDVTMANVHLLQFVVIDPNSKKVETERDDATHEVKVLRSDSLSFKQINTAKSGRWKVTKTYTIDIERESILINVTFESKAPSLNPLIYYDPSLKNSGMHDSAWTHDGALLAKDSEVVSALLASPSFNRNIDNKIVATADDPLIAKSVKVIDQVIKVDTPNGPGFYRYNHDGYGEMDDGRRWNWDGKYTGKGRLWALLSGERGQYELAQCLAQMPRRGDAEKAEQPTGRVSSTTLSVNRCMDLAKSRLNNMLGFANDGLMIPEQVWDKKEVPNADRQFVPELKFGEGAGSATPLAWSMAQFIRLAVNLKSGRNLDTPQIVYDHYIRRNK